MFFQGKSLFIGICLMLGSDSFRASMFEPNYIGSGYFLNFFNYLGLNRTLGAARQQKKSPIATIINFCCNRGLETLKNQQTGVIHWGTEVPYQCRRYRGGGNIPWCLALQNTTNSIADIMEKKTRGTYLSNTRGHLVVFCIG